MDEPLTEEEAKKDENMTEIFIEEVRQREFLYNTKLPEYKDLQLRQNAWEDIATKLQITAEKAKDKWATLRAYYRKVNRRRDLTNDLAVKKIDHWKYEEKMSFILPFLSKVKRYNNLDSSQPSADFTIVTEPHIWTEEDKRLLLMALRKHGDSDLSLLHSSMPEKSIVQIRAMVNHYKKLAQVKWLKSEYRKSDEVRNWIEIIEKVSVKQKGYIQDIIPRMLKYIALFEKKNVQSDIDLSTAYTFLSEVSYGKSTKELPERTGYFLYQCLVKLAQNLQKQDIQNSQLYLKQLECFEDLLKPVDESMINPLDVPKNLLMTSPVDFSEDITE